MTRRRLLLAAALVLLWLVVAGTLLFSTARHLRHGRDAARRASERVDAETVTNGEALPDLRRARDEFSSAARASGNPVLLPLRAVPVLGRQLRSVHTLSKAARDVSGAATGAVERLHEVLRDPEPGGLARVAELRAIETAIAAASERVGAVDDLGPRHGLVSPLAKAHNELARRLIDARQALADADAGALAGLRLLEGPRRYILVAANNAEMRAGSGMWLSGGELSTGAGRLSLGEVAPMYAQANPPRAPVPIGDVDLRDRWDEAWPHPSADWRGLMVSPRVAASAAVGVAMWRAAGREPVDGVIVVDPVALAALVRATGPVDVDGRRYTADEIVPTLLHRQYLSLAAGSPQQHDRRELLGKFAKAAIVAVDRGDWDPVVLAREMAKAVAGRHVLAWSAEAVEEKGWQAAGVSGDLSEDSLLVSVLNRGGNKLDWFLESTGRLTTARIGRDSEVAIHLTLRNTTPRGLPQYIVGPPPEQHWPAGTYVGVATFDVPGWARDVRIDGLDSPPVQGRDGRAQLIAEEVFLPAGTSREIVVRFRRPGHDGSIRVEPSARVPGILWHYGHQTWQDIELRTVKWHDAG